MNTPTQGLNPELTEAIIGTLQEPILILDQNLRVIVAGTAFYEKFGVTYDEVKGKPLRELGNGEWNIDALNTLLEQVNTHKTTIEGFELTHTFKRLGERTMLINAREIKFKDHRKNILLSIVDVTALRKSERDKENLMLQKDTLLKEMRHRIANSLQLIASIILLKAGTVKSEESRAQLEDAHDRILSIATVQRNLDPTTDGSMIPVVNYLTILCQSLAKSMIGGRKPITLSVSGSAGEVTPDEAIALGLLTTELVINSLKHAFPSGEGAVTIYYASDAATWKLTIADDGIGMAATHADDHEGLGTSIVESLCKQLNAEVRRESSPKGTTVSIMYPVTHLPLP